MKCKQHWLMFRPFIKDYATISKNRTLIYFTTSQFGAGRTRECMQKTSVYIDVIVFLSLGWTWKTVKHICRKSSDVENFPIQWWVCSSSEAWNGGKFSSSTFQHEGRGLTDWGGRWETLQVGMGVVVRSHPMVELCFNKNMKFQSLNL